jgi:hypothetical protein
MPTSYSLLPGLRYGLVLALLGLAGKGLAQPTLANDAAVEAIYTLNQLPLEGGPHVVRARIHNVGARTIAAQTVTLQVVGASSFFATAAIGALAPNALAVVTFPAFTPAAVGSQSLLVSLDADDDPNNNTLIETQDVTTGTASYITSGLGNTTSLGFQAGGSQAFVARFEAAGPRDVVTVRAFIADFNSVGQTVFGVVADPVTGAILGRSADYVVTTADVGVLHSFTMNPPVPVPGGDYLAGLGEVTNPARQFFPMGLQAERPTRPGSFYSLGVTNPGPPGDLGPFNYGKMMLETVLAPPASCPAPRNVSVTGTPTTATLAFTGPANGSGYQVVYGPTGFNPATAGTTLPATTSPLTITGLTPLTGYDFYVRALCGPTDQSTLAGPVSLTTPCVPPIITSIPYDQDFNTVAPGQPLPCGITVQDANGDGNTWQARATVPTQANPNLPIGRGGTGNAMVYFYNQNDNTIGGDDWFYLPAIRLRGGDTYALAFYYRAQGASFPEALEVSYGTAANPAAQTNRIYSNLLITNAAYQQASFVSQPATLTMTPPATGIYYIGFHARSAADQFFLAVDDARLIAPLSTSDALTRAVSVFPNPSESGRFSLEVHGANARALGVEVTNALGQHVYTGTAPDNFRTELNLSALAGGIYTLRVTNGAEYTQQRLVIVK